MVRLPPALLIGCVFVALLLGLTIGWLTTSRAGRSTESSKLDSARATGPAVEVRGEAANTVNATKATPSVTPPPVARPDPLLPAIAREAQARLDSLGADGDGAIDTQALQRAKELRAGVELVRAADAGAAESLGDLATRVDALIQKQSELLRNVESQAREARSSEREKLAAGERQQTEMLTKLGDSIATLSTQEMLEYTLERREQIANALARISQSADEARQAASARGALSESEQAEQLMLTELLRACERLGAWVRDFKPITSKVEPGKGFAEAVSNVQRTLGPWRTAIGQVDQRVRDVGASLSEDESRSLGQRIEEACRRAGDLEDALRRLQAVVDRL